jgi:4-oxalocrotonate tautomerase
VRLWLLLLHTRQLLPARLSAGVLTSAGIAAATAPASPVDRSLKLPRYDVERGQRRSERYRSRRSLGRTNARYWDIPARSARAPTRYLGGSVMPFVRIDLMRGKSIEYRKTIGEIIYNAMRDVIDVPKDDKFQVITEHPAEAFNVSESYLGNHYSKDVVLIQITLNAGRSVEQKKAFYKRIVDDMNTQLNVRPQDVVINLVEVAKENWSFGGGIAQYAA